MLLEHEQWCLDCGVHDVSCRNMHFTAVHVAHSALFECWTSKCPMPVSKGMSLLFLHFVSNEDSRQLSSIV